jgi:hypothetical protein
MPCDTRLKAQQTISERKTEVQKVIALVSNRLAAGLIKPRVGAAGGIAFEGLTDAQRDGVTDACIYRRILATGSALAKQRIIQAEMLAGRSVNKMAVAQGLHSHDNGATWHGKG